ncbi:recombinase [Erwinia phage Snitter]|nr:recombinase [Erwinia phage Snitter]
MKQSESILNIAPAIIKAKAQFVKAKQSKKNNHLGNTYATLSDVLEAVEPGLNANSIMVMQSVLDTSTETVMHLETMLLHVSGEFMSFQYNMPIEKKTAQAYGSTTSYARRYALAAALGISQSDDDAEIAKMSAEDVKKRAAQITDIDSLRKLFASAKAQLSAGDWKIAHPFLLERNAEITSAEETAKTGEAKPEAPAKQSGFNPNKPEPVNKAVDEKPSEGQNKPSEDISTFA